MPSALALGLPTLANAWSPPQEPPFPHPFDGLAIPRDLNKKDLPFFNERSRREAARFAADDADRRDRRRARRQSGEAKRERRESRVKYAKLSRDGAKALVRDRFARQLDAFGFLPSKLRRAGRVRKYLDERTARVSDGRGGEQLMVSAAPLQVSDANGDQQPVDLSLAAEGDTVKPRQPAVEVAFGSQLGAGFALQRPGIKLVYADARPEIAASPLDDDTLIYTDAAVDTDVTVKAMIGGLETAAQLRSAAAPEDIPLRFTLPDGVALQQQTDGSILFVRANAPVAKLDAPTVVDAEGVDVPASYAVDGATVTMHVGHRARDVAYPLLADPVLEDWATDGAGGYNQSWYYGRNLQGLNDWFFAESNANYFPHSNGYCLGNLDCYGSGYGLHVYGYNNSEYQNGQFGEWLYSPPGQTTYIPRVEFGWSWHDPRGNAGTRLATAIYSTKINGFTAYHGIDAPVANLYDTVRAGDNAPGATAANGNLAVFAMSMIGSRFRPNWTSVTAGGAVVFLDDPEAPTVDALNAPTGWVRGAVPVTITASDPGLGVKYFNLYAPNKSGPAEAFSFDNSACTGTRSKRCPSTGASHTFQLDTARLPDGPQTLGAQAYDPVYHAATGRSATLKVDNARPDIGSPTGSLWDNRLSDDSASEPSLGVGRYSLNINATDAHSGIESVKISLDGEEQVSSAEGRASWDLSTLGKGQGKHYVVVTVTDKAGNVSSQIIAFAIDFREADKFVEDADDQMATDLTSPVTQVESPTEEESDGIVAGAASAPSVGPADFGIADNNFPLYFNLFDQARFQELGVSKVRVTAPFNVATDDVIRHSGDSESDRRIRLDWDKVQTYARRAADVNQPGGAKRVLISFERCTGTFTDATDNQQHPCSETPSDATYTRAMEAFLGHPDLQTIAEFSAWNEPNLRGYQPTGVPAKAYQAGKYWANSKCGGGRCTVAAGEFTDSMMLRADDSGTSGGKYFDDYRAGARSLGATPTLWAWHAYKDAEDAGKAVLRGDRTFRRWQRFVHFRRATGTGEIWITETGAVRVQSNRPRCTDCNLTSLANAEMKAYVSDRTSLTRNSRRLGRFYYYQFRGEERYDAGLVTPVVAARPPEPSPQANIRRTVFCLYKDVIQPGSSCSSGS